MKDAEIQHIGPPIAIGEAAGPGDSVWPGRGSHYGTFADVACIVGRWGCVLSLRQRGRCEKKGGHKGYRVDFFHYGHSLIEGSFLESVWILFCKILAKIIACSQCIIRILAMRLAHDNISQ